MTHSLDDKGNMIVNLNDYTHISDSILHRHKIDYLCQRLSLVGDITHFSITFRFHDGASYYISNLYLWAIPYRTEGYCRGDKDHSPEIYNGNEFFVQAQQNIDAMQSPIVSVLSSRYNLNTTFAMVRQCGECDMIVETYHSDEVSAPEKLYHRVKSDLENFLIYFLDEMSVEIVASCQTHRYRQIFTDQTYRASVIRRAVDDYHIDTLTPREVQCLHYIRLGLRSSETAQAMNISVETVTTHLKNIRRKWNCKTVAQAVAIALRHRLL